MVEQLFDSVKAYGEALCDCIDPVWAKAELLAGSWRTHTSCWRPTGPPTL